MHKGRIFNATVEKWAKSIYWNWKGYLSKARAIERLEQWRVQILVRDPLLQLVAEINVESIFFWTPEASTMSTHQRRLREAQGRRSSWGTGRWRRGATVCRRTRGPAQGQVMVRWEKTLTRRSWVSSTYSRIHAAVIGLFPHTEEGTIN